jgi:hypothetical protein
VPSPITTDPHEEEHHRSRAVVVLEPEPQT